ncbi:MAG: hypothetical protein CRN43_15260 [Candidatus Nephrothrix sp. EaCA]|nr:MAG: hypothetical protein CRN43_15260 [Candidatus Nephrothrix sp. EaCA]
MGSHVIRFPFKICFGRTRAFFHKRLFSYQSSKYTLAVSYKKINKAYHPLARKLALKRARRSG